MLASVRSRFLLSVLAFSVAGFVPVQAQVNGAPPSVTSLGFGGRFSNGVPPSVTSSGPNGYGNNWSVFGNCCANFLWPVNPNPPRTSERHHHKDRASLAGVVEPVYIPYAVPYASETEDDPSEVDAGPRIEDQDPPPNHTGNRDRTPKDSVLSKPTPSKPEEPVAAQPSTVLVFKDGHRADVVNYAIVGDTLFDFSAGRTRKVLLADLDLAATQKANDDRGIDFQIPASTAHP